MTHEPALRRLAIEVTRATSNNLFQVATLIMAATALEVSIDVLFRDEALLKLRRGRINVPEWSRAYAPVMAELAERLKAAEFTDMESFLRDAKEHGDDVRYWACSETLADQRVSLAELTSLLDGERDRKEFLADAQNADAVLTF